MISLLDPAADLAFIRESSPQESVDSVVQEYLRSRNSILRHFLIELTADYEDLYRLAAAEAVHDPVLAGQLVECQREFREAVRSIRRRLWLETVFPAFAVRVLVSGKLSRVVADRLVVRLDNMRVLFKAQTMSN